MTINDLHDMVLMLTVAFFIIVFVLVLRYDDEAERCKLEAKDERAVAERDAEQRWLPYKRERELDDVIARITGIHRDSERTRISVAERKQFEIDKDAA